ncbi:phage tail tape measure protein [Candidatus Avelusimicrobium faecicola]|uniref:phage tail tape measure protein n=1 Tax=Candidatus Avelusimicrobium faecicola TaxID=3416205 RepID=UPI003D10E147
MASKILSIELILESKSFTAQMQKVNDAFAKTNSDLQKFGKSMQKVGASFAAVGGAITAALGVAVKSLANAADVADDTAKRTGLTVEAVQELGYVAKMTGSNLATVEVALRTIMQKGLTDSGTESAAFTSALETLGLSLAELRAMNPQAQFDALSQAIAGVADPSQRAGLAMTVFGRAGTALLPMLAEGADGIAKLKDEAHKYGYVMSQEVAEAGSNFNDNLDRLKGSLGGLAQQVVAGLLPTLNSLVKCAADVVAGIKEWINNNPNLVSTLAHVVASVGAVLTVFGALVAACGSWIALAPAVGAAWTIATGPIGITIMAIAGVVAGIVALWKNWDKVCHYMVQAWDTLTIVICKGVELWLSSWETALGWIPGIGEKLRTAMYGVQNAAAQASFDIGQRQLQYEKDKNEKLLAETQKFTSAQNEALISAQTEQQDIASKNTEEHLASTTEKVEGFWQTVYDVSAQQSLNITSQVSSVYSELQNNLSVSFYALFQQIGNGWSGLKDIAINFCQSMYQSFVKMLADLAAEQIKNIIAVQVANVAAAKVNIAANAAEAGSKAAAASAGWALWGAIAIGAGIMAAVLAFADGFATGGVVPGNSFSGDNVLARVNSGEMILNRAQQARLFDIADGNAEPVGGSGAVINQTINVQNAGDLTAITQAIKRGTVEALEFANVAYKAGAKRNKYVG